MIINQDNSNLIIIEKKNEVYITVDCESDVQREISEFFTFYVPGYKFMPAFRTRMWDGKIRLFSQKTKEIYFGLFPYIKAFAEERGYNIVAGKDVEIDNKVDKDVVTKFSNSLGQKFEARDYQIDAIYHSLKRNRALLLSPTASGKSFIIYSLIRYYCLLYTSDAADEEDSVDKEIVKKFSNSLGQKFEARDYQIDAIYHSLKFNRALLLSPTASGKSFIIYSLIRYYSHLICLLYTSPSPRDS